MPAKKYKGMVLADGKIKGTMHYLPRGWQKYLHDEVEYTLIDDPAKLKRPKSAYTTGTSKGMLRAKVVRVTKTH